MFSMLKNSKLLVCLLVLQMLECNTSSYLKDDLRSSLINKFKANFDAFLTNLFNDEKFNHAERFQLDILKFRNNECEKFDSSETDIDKILNKTKSDQLISSIIEKWSNNSQYEQYDDDINQLCLDTKSIKEHFTINEAESSLNKQNLGYILMNQFVNKGCDLCQGNHEHLGQNKKFKVWFYSFLAATLITLSSFSGAFLLPITRHKHYKKVLMFLISLAIGTLVGTAILHLIPQAFGISEDSKYANHHAYVWKALVIIGGLYLFFLVEQIMRFFIQFRKHRAIKKDQKIKIENLKKIVYELKEFSDKKETTSLVYVSDEDDELNKKLSKKVTTLSQQIYQSTIAIDKTAADVTIAPVAWIIICGEMLHNLIDGLSIGAAFSETILKGTSLALAIICEEFPHKLGDFAVLLTSGMSFKLALFCNFLTSSLIYVGVVFGIVLGENLNANQWIYAIAGGMFLYIAVCDMIPELTEMSLEIEKESMQNRNVPSKRGHQHSHLHSHHEHSHHVAEDEEATTEFAFRIKISNIIIQNSGILVGFGCMLILALFAEKIKI